MQKNGSHACYNAWHSAISLVYRFTYYVCAKERVGVRDRETKRWRICKIFDYKRERERERESKTRIMFTIDCWHNTQKTIQRMEWINEWENDEAGELCAIHSLMVQLLCEFNEWMGPSQVDIKRNEQPTPFENKLQLFLYSSTTNFHTGAHRIVCVCQFIAFFRRFVALFFNSIWFREQPRQV